MEFPIPTAGSQPAEITVGPDGALWFIETNANQFASITIAGSITEYPVPTSASGAFGIAAGGGFLWFTEFFGDRIARVGGLSSATPVPMLSDSSWGLLALALAGSGAALLRRR